ncbi:MAG: hypothetical protein WCT07_01900 [Candidatus Paceibacterota bacterium]|jgi:hypothetical protein
MKKILNTIAIISFGFIAFTISTSQASAQEWISDTTWNDYTPAYNGNTDYVDTSCAGCGVGYSSPSFVTDTTWNDYTPAYNGNTDYVNVSPTYTGGLDTTSVTGTTYTSISPSYVAPTYEAYDYSYPSVDYVGSSYSPTYTTPTYTYPTYTTPTYTTPTYTYPTYTTPTYTPPVTTCPAGSTLTNGTCQINTVSCPTGSSLVNGKCVISTTVNIVTCSNGTVVSYASQCPVTYVPPTYIAPTYNYPTYSYTNYSYTSPAVTYQTCWNGSVIPSYSVCSPQYKVCANGTSVLINQNCYYGGTYVAPYIAPQPVKFNNVVTSVVTEITKDSARCNGIGLIANNVTSAGWFEYGETRNLGRSTTAVSIGSSATAPFSNVLTNLKPKTTYYCRAVMQNQYGTVKGEIVAFSTKSTVSNYVKPVTTTKPVTTKPKTNTITCSDGSVITVKNGTVASLLSQGQKLISLQIEKLSGNLASKNTVSYRLSYKNISDSRLTDVLIKVALPQEVTFVTSSAGAYDQATHTIVIDQNTIDSSSEGVVTWTVEVTKDAPVGKSIVTTAYALYTVPSTSVQDEVTAYVVGSTVPQVDGFDGNAKHVIGQGEGSFLPNTLVEWLALVAILFIIFILGRSIYASYQENKNSSH